MASTIDRSLPAANSPASSAEMRGQFGAAADDVEALQSGKEDAGTAAAAVSAHDGDAGAHPGTFDAAGTASAAVAAHDSSGTAHGGVENAFAAHDGAGGNAHSLASGADSGFMSASAWTKLAGIEDGANAYSHPNHTGDVTSVGDGAQTIANDAVTNAKLANVAANTIKGRATTTGDPTDIDIEALADGGTPAAADVVLGKKQAGDLVKFLGSNLGGGGSGTVQDIAKDGSVVVNDATQIDFRDTGDATVTVFDAGAGVARVTIDATAGAGGGGVGAGSPFAVGELTQVSSAAGDGEIISSGLTATTVNNHIGDSTIHFSEASINHANIQNVGTNSHATIDILLATALYDSQNNTVNKGAGQGALTFDLESPDDVVRFRIKPGVGSANSQVFDWWANGTSLDLRALNDDYSVTSRTVAQYSHAGDVDFPAGVVTEQNVGLHQPATNEITVSTEISLQPGATSRNYCNVATILTISAPTSGDGIASLHLGPLADNVGFSGFTRIMGTPRAAGKAADAKIERFADGTTTLAWGAQEA